MDTMELGISLFEKNNVKMSYKFRMAYGSASATLFPTWQDRENQRSNENPQTDIRMFTDDEVMSLDRMHMINHIRKIVNKTNLENDLKENNLFFGLNIIISGMPSLPALLLQSDSDYDEYIEIGNLKD